MDIIEKHQLLIEGNRSRVPAIKTEQKFRCGGRKGKNAQGRVQEHTDSTLPTLLTTFLYLVFPFLNVSTCSSLPVFFMQWKDNH